MPEPDGPAREEVVLARIGDAIAECRRRVDGRRLRSGEERYTHYFLAYVRSVAQAVARHFGAEYVFRMEIPVYVETSLLCGHAGGDALEGARLIPHVESTEFGQLGAMEGREDAEEIDSDARLTGTPRLLAYFGS
jgi:hypothetical protein